MVSFKLSEDQQALVDILRRYAEKDVRPQAHEMDESAEPNADIIKTGWEFGLIPTALPEELGGLGDMSAITGALAMEELASGDLSSAFHLLTPALFAYPVALYGTAEQREELLPLFLEETFVPASSALIEPGIMFDPFDLKTTASAQDGKIVINGVKGYVPLADEASHILVYARNSETGETEAYIVPRDAEGVSIDFREKLMGLRSLPTYRVKFENVTLEPSAKLGGAVGINFQNIIDRQNIALAAAAVGVARGAFEYARDYAKQRQQFGRAIAQNQSIAFMLAEMAIEIDATRLMVWECAWKADQGLDGVSRDAYLTRQYANKMVLTVTDGGVQTLGGYGFIREYPAERWLRNGRGFPTFDGLAIV